MTAEYYQQHYAEAQRIAVGEWKKSNLYEAEDVEQAIWEHVMGNWKYYAKADDKYRTACMVRAARNYVRKEREDYMYHSGAFVYTPKLVANYLESCAWKPLEQVPDVDARVDLQEAFAILARSAPKQAAAVFKRYALGEEDMSSAERMNVSRGTESICHRLNSGLRLSAESIDLVIARES